MPENSSTIARVLECTGRIADAVHAGELQLFIPVSGGPDVLLGRTVPCERAIYFAIETGDRMAYESASLTPSTNVFE
jgi:hypothetical protein